jgi:hypothetical protein
MTTGRAADTRSRRYTIHQEEASAPRGTLNLDTQTTIHITFVTTPPKHIQLKPHKYFNNNIVICFQYIVVEVNILAAIID